eukprot:13845328-Ditylum_brightwellii.AAC.1
MRYFPARRPVLYVMVQSLGKSNNNNENEQQTCSPMEKWLKRVKLCTKNAFPFLDMNMMWDNMGFLRFGVYHKEGQAINYVDHSSCHRSCTFKSIALGVYLQLGRLTSKTTENGKKRLNKIHPEHAEALLAAELEPVEFLALHKIWEKEALSKICMKRKCHDNWRTFF